MSDVTRDQILVKLSEFDAIGQEEFLKRYPKNEDSDTTWLIHADKLYPVKPIWFSAQTPYDGGVRVGQTRLNSQHAERKIKALGFVSHRGLRREELEQYLKLRKEIEPSISPSGSVMDDINLSNDENDDPEYRRRMAGSYVRDAKVREKILKRANGICEECGEPGFVKCNGQPYLETHHVIALSEQGPDKPHNVIALCATDHRRAHFAENWKELQDKFLAKLSKYKTES